MCARRRISAGRTGSAGGWRPAVAGAGQQQDHQPLPEPAAAPCRKSRPAAASRWPAAGRRTNMATAATSQGLKEAGSPRWSAAPSGSQTRGELGGDQGGQGHRPGQGRARRDRQRAPGPGVPGSENAPIRKAARVPRPISMPRPRILIPSRRAKTPSSGRRGGRRITSGSGGSTPRAIAGRPSVTRLIKRIWIGRSGSGSRMTARQEHDQHLAGVAGQQVVDELADVVVDAPALLARPRRWWRSCRRPGPCPTPPWSRRCPCCPWRCRCRPPSAPARR